MPQGKQEFPGTSFKQVSLVLYKIKKINRVILSRKYKYYSHKVVRRIVMKKILLPQRAKITPEEVLDEINKFEYINKSPYSSTYYNVPKLLGTISQKEV